LGGQQPTPLLQQTALGKLQQPLSHLVSLAVQVVLDFKQRLLASSQTGKLDGQQPVPQQTALGKLQQPLAQVVVWAALGPLSAQAEGMNAFIGTLSIKI
jgi:hypothetical protein